jgi:hypothetical protein
MHTRLGFCALLLTTACLAETVPPQLAVSRRVPTVGDTVQLSVLAPGGAADQDWVISAESAGRSRPLGKTRPATDPARPFEPSIEWRPNETGMFRIIATCDAAQVKRLLPVVARDTVFAWHGPTSPAAEWVTHRLDATEEEIDALHARGVVALRTVPGVSYLGAARWEDLPRQLDLSTFAPGMLKGLTDVGPWDGIAVDELGMWQDHPRQTELALQYAELLGQARAALRGKTIAAWLCGALTPLECNLLRDKADLIICQVYGNFLRAWYDQQRFEDSLRQRIETARSLMVTQQTVIALSLTTDHGGVTPEELEQQVRLMRLLGPEIHGIAFYSTARAEPAVIKRANDCCQRYFLRPVVSFLSRTDLTLSDAAPQDQGVVRISATVHNVGGSDARNVQVKFWEGDPAREGRLIGATQVIPRLPAAGPPDVRTRNDKTPAPTAWAREDGRATVSVPWRATRGVRELWVQILPDSGTTLLEGFASCRVGVR